MKGTFLLVIDVELAWGLVHRKKIDLHKTKKVCVNVRKVLPSIFNLLEKYQIPTTWSILGHLMLDQCKRDSKSGLPHPDMPRPRYSWLKEDWYRYDPCSNIEKDPAWYGKDITDKIVEHVKESSLPHEIGCHSFSHLQFGDPGCREEVARAEIQKCVDLIKTEYKIIPKVFTFPRTYVGHINLLKEYGFVAFIDTPPKLNPCVNLEKTLSNYLKTQFSLFVQFLSYYFLFPPHTTSLKEALPELWSVQGCMGYGRKPLIPLPLVTFKVIQGINRAIREGRIFSMFTHLKDFGGNGSFFSEFEKILYHVNQKREEGKLQVRTLSDLVSEYTSLSQGSNS